MKEVVLALVLLCLVQYGVAVNQDCPANLPKNDYLLQFGDFCYEFVLNHFGTWHDAEKDCLSRGGFLTDIHSYAENNFILNSLQVLNFVRDKGVWIGLTDEIYEGTWKWASASAFTFSNWAPGQPGVLGGSEDCALLEISDFGHWHDYPCDGNIFGRQNHGWVCKYRTV